MMSGGQESSAQATLVIGDAPGPAHAVRIGFAALDAETLARVAPVFVICRLFAPESDAMGVAETLSALRWKGRLIVVASGVPNRAMVQREIQSGAPGVKVELVPELQG